MKSTENLSMGFCKSIWESNYLKFSEPIVIFSISSYVLFPWNCLLKLKERGEINSLLLCKVLSPCLFSFSYFLWLIEFITWGTLFYVWPSSLLSFFPRVLKILPVKGNLWFLYIVSNWLFFTPSFLVFSTGLNAFIQT